MVIGREYLVSQHYNSKFFKKTDNNNNKTTENHFIPYPSSRHQFVHNCNCNSYARLPGQAAGPGCRARLHVMVQYAESMVKIEIGPKCSIRAKSPQEENNNSKARLRPALYVHTNAGKTYS
jgi:hypothetical protein